MLEVQLLAFHNNALRKQVNIVCTAQQMWSRDRQQTELGVAQEGARDRTRTTLQQQILI